MKSLTLFLILFIIESSVSKIDIGDYSIDIFKNTIKNEGLFDTILLIKTFYGTDPSIISCEELNKNHRGYCKKLVTEYMPNKKIRNMFMPNSPIAYAPKRIIPILKNFTTVNITSKEEAEQNKLISNPRHKWDKLVEILSEKYSLEEAINIANRIIKRVEKSDLKNK